MKYYFYRINKEEYQKVIARELTDELIDYLNDRNDKVYIHNIKTSIDKKTNTITNKVEIYERGFFGIINMKVCEIIGKQVFSKFTIHNNDIKYIKTLVDKSLSYKTENVNILPEESLDAIIKSLSYEKILVKAENNRVKSKEEYQSYMKVTKKFK